MMIFSNTTRTAQLDTTALSLEAPTCTRSSACRRTLCPTTHGLSSLHPDGGPQNVFSGFLLVAADSEGLWKFGCDSIVCKAGVGSSECVAISVSRGVIEHGEEFGSVR